MANDTVVDNPQQHRFELRIGDGAMAAAYYRFRDDRIVLTHTEVPDQYAGQGIGTRLAAGVFDAIRASGRKAVLVCPFMRSFVEHHPEYADLVVS